MEEKTFAFPRVLRYLCFAIIGPVIMYSIFLLMGSTYKAAGLMCYIGAGYVCFLVLFYGTDYKAPVAAAFATLMLYLYWRLTPIENRDVIFSLISWLVPIALILAFLLVYFEDEKAWHHSVFFLSLAAFICLHHFVL